MKEALAHFLLEDRAIGALIHIDPEDSPFVGENSTFYIEIKDKEGKFDLAKCNCTMRISKDGKEIDLVNLTPSFPYVFPEKGIYHLEFRGQPKYGEDFQRFNFTYDLRVSRENTQRANPEQGNPSLYIFGGLGILLLIIIAFKFFRKK